MFSSVHFAGIKMLSRRLSSATRNLRRASTYRYVFVENLVLERVDDMILSTGDRLEERDVRKKKNTGNYCILTERQARKAESVHGCSRSSFCDSPLPLIKEMMLFHGFRGCSKNSTINVVITQKVNSVH